MPSPLPLFPLNTVLVPGLVLPLHIFEPRYRAMVETLLERPDEDSREFGIIAVRDGRDVSEEGIDALYPVGTATVLRQAERLEDGRFDIVTTGSRRFRVVEVDVSEPLVWAQVEFLADATEPADDALALQVAIGFRKYREALSGQVSEEVDADEDDLPDDPTVLSYLVTAAMVLPTDQRQALLAAPSTGERLRRERRLLRTETALISLLSAVPAIDLGGPSASPN